MIDDEKRARLEVVGEVAAAMAHELRATLQVIAANAYLARQCASAGHQGPFLANIERNAALAQEIVDSVLALARGDAVLAEALPLADVLSRARETLPEPGARFDDAIPPGLAVTGHLGLLARLFHVLYENAIGVSVPRRPTITTTARATHDTIEVDVHDDGPGVAAEIVASLFEPLVTGRTGGTGLGLPLAKRVAEAHKGSLALVPTAPGATFRVTLPR